MAQPGMKTLLDQLCDNEIDRERRMAALRACDGLLQLMMRMVKDGVKYGTQDADLKAQLRSINHCLKSIRPPVNPAHPIDLRVLATMDRLVDQCLMLLRINGIHGDELIEWQLESAALPKETRFAVKNLHGLLMFALHVNEVYPLRHYVTKNAVETAIKRAVEIRTPEAKIVAKQMASVLVVLKAMWLEINRPRSLVKVSRFTSLPESPVLEDLKNWYNKLYPPLPPKTPPPPKPTPTPGRTWEAAPDTTEDTEGFVPFMKVIQWYSLSHSVIGQKDAPPLNPHVKEIVDKYFPPNSKSS
ncbi:hypothetical protein BZA05DRAFT_409266 [Tricharina praecox]|uniref:uncharacterized protein n=1 Tax=Tricharina praecox TaxID=43433 RepID=UPI00221F6287|nr:uncharacterized protein BZA05DRAFT_409266 [Tricharina praecox]KAI5844749.1 hypothetical protein BZA05DRAFT_409266 [Tricharina praecox]